MLQVGVTHDIVIYLNNSIQCGLIVKPYTYRVDHQPNFVNRLSTGDPSGLDLQPWQSFVQSSFMQGAGIMDWSSAHGGAGYAEGHMMDPVYRGHDDPSWAYGQNNVPQFPMGASPRTSQIPMDDKVPLLMSGSYKMFVFQYSNIPHIVNCTGIVRYEAPEKSIWHQGVQCARPYGWEGGSWAVAFSKWSQPVLSATKYTNIIWTTHADKNIRGWSGGTTTFTPAFNTTSVLVTTYDEKLWRTNGGQTAYYDAVNDIWSDYYPVGNIQEEILNVSTFAGRLYFGKQDGLYVFDAGRIYRIQDYSQIADETNFSLMVEFRGALYYNIVGQLYRLTGGGVIEKIRLPLIEGTITSGTVSGDELIFITREYNDNYARVWIFNPDSGGVTQWFDNQSASWDRDNSLRYVASLKSHFIFFPVSRSNLTNPQIYGSTRNLPDNTHSIYYGGFCGGYYNDNGYFITSKFDMGFPGLNKKWHNLIVDTEGKGVVTVYYSTDFEIKTEWPYVDEVAGFEVNFPGGRTLEATWHTLGVINAGVEARRKDTFAFPQEFQSNNINLKFEHSSYNNDSQFKVHSFEIEYQIIGPEKRIHSAQVLALDYMILPNGLKDEQSSAFISATLFSVSESQLPYVVSLPYPVVGHTVKAIVKINSPGVSVPVLAYGHSIEAEAFVVFKEV